jgi:hypothetical protein
MALRDELERALLASLNREDPILLKLAGGRRTRGIAAALPRVALCPEMLSCNETCCRLT